jgi:valyl-tRNA synthetase
VRGVEGTLSAADLRRLLEALVPVAVVDELPEGVETVRVVAGGVEAALRTGAAPADRGRLERQLAQVEEQIAQLTARLDNPRFVERARADVVEGARRSLAEATAKRELLRPLVAGG